MSDYGPLCLTLIVGKLMSKIVNNIKEYLDKHNLISYSQLHFEGKAMSNELDDLSW